MWRLLRETQHLKVVRWHCMPGALVKVKEAEFVSHHMKYLLCGRNLISQLSLPIPDCRITVAS